MNNQEVLKVLKSILKTNDIIYQVKCSFKTMKEESTQLAEDIKIYSQGLVLSLEEGKIQESMDYVNKMKIHLDKVQEYLELKKSIPKNE